MVVAVAAKGAGLGAWVDDSFAGCRQIVVVREDGRFEAFANPYPGDASGMALAEKLIAEVRPLGALVTGGVGTEVLELFARGGIAVHSARSGSVMELAEAAAAGTLPAARPQG